MSNLRAGVRSYPPRLWIGGLVLAVSLALAAAGVPDRFGSSIEALSRLRAGDTWTRGAREVLGQDLHDALVDADTLLPRNAAVLLVTPGRDTRRSEYFAFHRALYVLAPRPVWWAAPAARDGTWESRWWSEIDSSADAAFTRAREIGASHVLLLGSGKAQVISVSSVVSPNSNEATWRPAPAPARAIAAFLIILVAGWAASSLVTQRNAFVSLTQTVAISWLVGCAVVSLAMFWMIRVGIPPGAQRFTIGILSVASAVLIGMRSRPRMAQLSAMSDGTRKGLAAILSGVLAVWLALEVTALVVRSSAGPLSGWDGWVTWAMKARVLFLQPDSAALLMDASREVANRSYPLLLPLTESWVFGWTGAADDRFAAFVTMSFLVALLALLLSELRPKVGLFAALALAIIFVSTSYAGLLASLGYADIVLAAYALAAALALQRWIETPDASPLLAAMLLGVLPWVKPEGVFLSVALVIGTWISMGTGQKKLRLLGWAAIATLVCAVPWYLLVAMSDIRMGAFASAPDLSGSRVKEILAGLASRAIAIEWHGIWLAAVAALVVIAAQRRWRNMLAIAISAYVIAITVVFLFSLYDPLSQHVLRSGDRLLLHVAPLALLMIAEVMGPRRASAKGAEPPADHRSA